MNESDVKCNNDGQYDLLIENQYDVDPLFGPSCSLTKPNLKSQADLSGAV
jgi:hypothetical protein